jgi:hypothetical protein
MESQLTPIDYFYLFILLAIYMLPSICAFVRGKTGIGCLIFFNIFWGWTALGWFICCFWAGGQTKQQAAWKAREAAAQAREAADRRVFYHHAAKWATDRPPPLMTGPRPHH